MQLEDKQIKIYLGKAASATRKRLNRAEHFCED